MPVLVRTLHADVHDQPVQPSLPDVRRAELGEAAMDVVMVNCPGRRLYFFSSAAKAMEPVSRKVISTPSLRCGFQPQSRALPAFQKTNAVQSRQDVFWNTGVLTMSLRQRARN